MITISNPPECLVDYIVLKDGCYCDTDGTKLPVPSPTSGFYIESLPGISVENLSDITPENNQTTQMVNSMVYFAAAIVEKRITAYLTENGFDLNKQGGEYEACKVSTTFGIPVSLEKGVRVSRANINASQARIFVSNIRIKTKGGNTTLYVKDSSGNVLWLKNITTVADVEQKIAVNKSFEPEIIFIVADNATVSLYEYDCTGSTACCGKAAQMRRDLSVMGWDGIQSSYTGFLGVCVSLNCTDKNIICNWLDRLQMAILYQAGAEILKEWVSPSSRINQIKTMGHEWAESHIEVWENQSIEFMNAEIRNIENLISYDKFCYKCVSNYRTIAVLPS